MPHESAATKARRYLTEGRVVISRVSQLAVIAQVRGDGTIHRCTWQSGTWSCSCPVRSDQCAHLIAVRLVTAIDL